MARPGKGSNVRFFLYSNTSKRFAEIHDGFVCGRIEGDLQFPDDKVVSRRQCQFFVNGNDVFVADLDSTNRTKVNNVPVQPGYKRRVQLNDVIEFGSQRLVLSSQDKFPAHVQDKVGDSRVFKAARRDDGKLTSEIPQELTKRTLVMLDKATFRKLRLEETFVRGRRRRRSTDVKVTGQQPESRRSTAILAALIVLAWVGPFLSLQLAGVFDSGLPVEASEIVFGLLVMGAIGAVLALGLYVRMVRPMSRGKGARAVWVVVLAVFALLFSAFLAKKTGLLARTAQNLAVARCIRSWDPKLCGTLVDLDQDEWIKLPTELRSQIETRLHLHH
jgi:hypothetical protein